MIRKKLLSEVLGHEFDSFTYNKESSDIRIVVDNNYSPIYINIYELAHKCKEWALNQDNCFSIVSGKVPNNYFCVVQYSFQWLGKDGYEEYFTEDTEPEAIFKACQWILDNKDKA